jgi:hypothetical protein
MDARAYKLNDLNRKVDVCRGVVTGDNEEHKDVAFFKLYGSIACAYKDRHKISIADHRVRVRSRDLEAALIGCCVSVVNAPAGYFSSKAAVLGDYVRCILRSVGNGYELLYGNSVSNSTCRSGICKCKRVIYRRSAEQLYNSSVSGSGIPLITKVCNEFCISRISNGKDIVLIRYELEELLLACGDLRRGGSAALDLAYVAAGRIDVFFEYRLSPWDVAAGSLLITEAGGVISDMNGTPLNFATPSPVLAASKTVYGQALQIVKE